MTDIAKFNSDVQRILKHDRQENSGKGDFMRVAADLQKLFARSTGAPVSLANSIFEYWENEYIHSSAEQENEPTAAHLDKLCAMLSFLENSDEGYDELDEHDWQELGDLVNYEAEDMPIDTLQSLMATLVSKGAY
jgi:hypothetical protein